MELVDCELHTSALMIPPSSAAMTEANNLFKDHAHKDLPSLMTWFKYSGNAIRPVYDPK